MEQLVNSHFPSPNPSVVSGVSASTGTDTRTSSIAPSDSVSQTNVPKPKKVAAQSLQVPRSGSASRNVSPTAPPSLSVPSSVVSSRDVTPSAESTLTADDDCDDNGTRVDVNTVLAGIPKPWNVGPVLPPPELPGPFHTASLKPDVLQQLSAGGKDKGKLARPAIGSFRDEDQQHLKLCLEFMDVLVATVCAFPNNEILWTFALLSNFWACKKLGRNYRLAPDSEHFRLVASRVSQSRGKLVTPAMSDGIRDHYQVGLSRQFLDEEDEDEKDQAEEEIRQRIVDMIGDGSFLAPADKPKAYFQNRWLAHLLKTAYWKGTSAKGFSPTHATHFASGISYPMLALAATATERMLNVVASGPSATAANYRNPALAFSHKLYYARFDSHLMTIVQLHNSSAGPKLRKYLTDLHASFMGRSKAPSALPGPGLKLTIPLSAFDNYGEEVEAPLPPKGRKPVPSSLKRSNTKTNLATLLKNPILTGNQKLEIINAIFGATEETVPNHRHAPNSTRTSRQYEGLLTEVNAEDNDSEAEARRAGVLPDAGNPGSTSQAWTAESDSEMVEGGDKGEIEGASKAEDEDEGEGEGESESRDDAEGKGNIRKTRTGP
ncbi:hypothetical protein FS749_012589 [Ceratobasidium sp. UAMH 11750]|nr:hypothetical protein FS749_012589 [Ceratobasidium sp. UAMH 11750]